MTYYYSTQYDGHDRYVIPFVDLGGNKWKILIQDPNFTGNATELTGAEVPVDWMGNGDESQENVVLGSTGTIRLVCQSGQESIFTFGALLPESINARRVQIMRYTYIGSGSYAWLAYWQGFIKPDIYTQDWDRAPFEIELPIVSAIAATEFFPMPMPTDNAYNMFMEQTNIAGIIKAVIKALGCDIRTIITNKPEYEDFNGELSPVPDTSPTLYHHWTQGVVSASYYYDIDSGIMRPKTFKDVLDNICYPYGKIQEVYLGIAIMMRWKEDAGGDARLSSMSVYSDYATQVLSDAVRFSSNYSPVYSVNLSAILPAGTDNTFSRIARPSSVKFTKNIDTSKEIFELTDNFIKPSLPIGNDLTGKPIQDSGAIASGFRKYVYAINKQYINTEFGTNWVFTNTDTRYDAELAFCRVVEVNGTNDSASYNVAIPLGFCFNINGSTENPVRASVRFDLNNGIRTTNGINVVKLTMKSYRISEKDMFAGEEGLAISTKIHDLTEDKWLNYTNGVWSWSDTESSVPVLSFEGGSDGYVLRFNEPRASGDNKLHQFQFEVYAFADTSRSGNVYGRIYTSFKLEYEMNKNFTVQGVAATFAESIERNGNTIEVGGSGDNININFETQCGTKNTIIDGSVLLPFNSFCNAQKYIDIQDREQIEMQETQFKMYGSIGYDFIRNYIIVRKGSEIYIPVAIGMNPRNNTVRLRLISTNVTA